MRTPPRHPRDGERGFILVGVVTFMLALTILGMSLFALSSYEAQFFGASATREQALQNCESGMSLVQALLESRYPRNLENARLAEGQCGITNAFAYQQMSSDPKDTTSSGPVRWDLPVFIVVSARSGGTERIVQAKYEPITSENPYQRLVTAGGGITYNSMNSSSPSTFVMSGRVWQYVQADRDTAWTDDVTWTSGRPVDPTPTPVPLADVFVDAKLAGPTYEPGKDFSEPDQKNLSFYNPDSAPRVYLGPPSPTDQATTEDHEYGEYSFYSHEEVEINLRGTAVWVLPQGICFRKKVTIRTSDLAKSESNSLIIVAKANRRDPGRLNRGIWFAGGLDLKSNDEGDYPRVYLVSEGDIGVTHDHNSGSSSDARTVSIVAGGLVELGGPDSGERFRLGYSSSAMDELADQLLTQGALPPVVGGGATAFKPLHGHWADITPR